MKKIEELEQQLERDIDDVIRRFDIRYPDSERAKIALQRLATTIRQIALTESFEMISKTLYASENLNLAKNILGTKGGDAT